MILSNLTTLVSHDSSINLFGKVRIPTLMIKSIVSQCSKYWFNNQCKLSVSTHSGRHLGDDHKENEVISSYIVGKVFSFT